MPIMSQRKIIRINQPSEMRPPEDQMAKILHDWVKEKVSILQHDTTNCINIATIYL